MIEARLYTLGECKGISHLMERVSMLCMLSVISLSLNLMQSSYIHEYVSVLVVNGHKTEIGVQISMNTEQRSHAQR